MASLSAPTTLAIFHAQKQRQPAASSSNVTLAPVDGSNGRLAVAAVNGDGVWTYDLKTLKPTTSFTVRPEVEFATSPVSYYRDVAAATAGDETAMDVDAPSTSAAARERITAIGVLSGGKLSKAEHGRAIWVWQGEDAGEHTQVVLSNPVASLLSTCIPSHPLVAITSKDAVFFSNDLTPTALALPVPAGSGKLIRARIQSLPSQTGARIVLIYENGPVLLLKADFEEVGISTIGVNILPGVGKGDKLATGDVSQDGTVTAITTKHRVITASIRPSPSSLFAPQPESSKPVFQRNPSSPPIALSLPSPSTPIAIVTSISALLLITSSAALLASAEPAASSSTKPTIVSLASVSPSTVAAVLNYDSPSRSQIVLMEAHIPASGVGIAHLLGSASATAHEFASTLAEPTAVPVVSSPLSQTIISDLKTTTDAKATWSSFLKSADTAVTAASTKTEKATHVLQEKGVVKAVLEIVFRRALGPEGISVVDGVVRRSGVVEGGLYAKEVVESLLAKKMVVNEYFESEKGGVLAALIALEDWTNVAVAIQSLPSLPPALAVQALNDPSHTEGIFRALVNSQLPVPAYRVALRQGVSAETARRILGVLYHWVKSWELRKFESFDSWVLDVDAVERGDLKIENVKVKPMSKPTSGLPDLELVLTQSTVFIDALLPTLINHQPAHALLSKLNEALASLNQVQSEMQALRYPVQAFLTLAKRDEKKPFKDLGNEGVGKWRVEDFLF